MFGRVSEEDGAVGLAQREQVAVFSKPHQFWSTGKWPPGAFKI